MKQISYLLFLLFAFKALNAQNGILDRTFGTGGIEVIDIENADNISKAIALQPDGKIVLAGYATKASRNVVSVVRLNSNGFLDHTFGMIFTILMILH